jgi:putative nucleotidyltransferase with HDIG domain
MTSEASNIPSNPADRLGARQVDLILDQLDSLPTLPEVATQLLNLTASSRSDAKQVIDLIRADQSLTARILSVAARADTGLRPEARTISKAVLMLGFDTVRSIVMSIKVYEMFGPSDAVSTGLDRREFWKHSIAVASASELLATRMRMDIDPEELFVCGLLHDIGKLALEQCLPKSYTRIVESCNAQYGSIAEYERQIIGVDHTIAGRRLARQWNLPTLVENVIWLHHQPVEALPDSVDHVQAVAVVHLADTIAREQRFGYSGNYTFPASSVRLATQIGVSAAALGHTIDALPAMIEKRAQMMGMGETSSESLFRSALSNANQELGRLNRKFHRRASQVASQAKALTTLSNFNRQLHGRQSLGQLASLAARTWAEAMGIPATEQTPVAAYVLSRSDDTALLARHTGADEQDVSLLPTRKDLSSLSAPAAGVAAATAIRTIAADNDALPLWLADGALSHRPLICGAQWVGGLLWPAPAADSPLTGEAQETITASLACAIAITETRERATAMAEQLAQSSQQLYAAQKSLAETRALTVVGEMASGAAHEMNNPLAVIAGRAQLMAESAAEDERPTWGTIAAQAQKLSDIVTELMEFAEPPEPRMAAVDMEDLIDRARELLASTDAADLMVRTDVAATTPAVFVDMDQAAQVLVELMANAHDAYRADPHVRIEAEPDPMTPRVLIKVIDRGEGMDAATVDQAFTPFFSARPAGRRRGMGLSRARRFVELIGGGIWINSTPGEGTTVFVTLPPVAESTGSQGGEPDS